jgi:hypothetical protein
MAIGCCPCISNPVCGIVGFPVAGSPDTMAEDSPYVRVGDIVSTGCGVGFITSTLAPTVLINDMQAATVGSSVAGCFVGQIITGAITVMSGQ